MIYPGQIWRKIEGCYSVKVLRQEQGIWAVLRLEDQELFFLRREMLLKGFKTLTPIEIELLDL